MFFDRIACGTLCMSLGRARMRAPGDRRSRRRQQHERPPAGVCGTLAHTDWVAERRGAPGYEGRNCSRTPWGRPGVSVTPPRVRDDDEEGLASRLAWLLAQQARRMRDTSGMGGRMGLAGGPGWSRSRRVAYGTRQAWVDGWMPKLVQRVVQ